MKADAEQTRVMLHDIQAKNEANDAERIRVAQLRAEGQAEFDRLQRMGQNMATTMMGHAQRKAAERAAILDEKSKQLEDYRAELEEAAKRIEESSAYLGANRGAEGTQNHACKGRRPRAATGRDHMDGRRARPWQLGGLIHFDPLFLAAGFFTAATSAELLGFYLQAQRGKLKPMDFGPKRFQLCAKCYVF